MLCGTGCVMTDSPIVPKPSWVQRTWVPKPSRLAKPEDRLAFERVASFRRSDGESGLAEKPNSCAKAIWLRPVLVNWSRAVTSF